MKEENGETEHPVAPDVPKPIGQSTFMSDIKIKKSRIELAKEE